MFLNKQKCAFNVIPRFFINPILFHKANASRSIFFVLFCPQYIKSSKVRQMYVVVNLMLNTFADLQKKNRHI